jgi:hypothetical protein
MKNEAEIREARRWVVRSIIKPGLSDDQKIILQGMSTALQWVCEEGGTTLQRIIGGERIPPAEQIEEPTT